MGMKFIGIEGNRDCYSPEQRESCTVGELIEFLSEYDENMPIYLVNDNGYTYGSLSYGDISEHYINSDGELDEEDIEEDELDERYMDSETYYIDIDGFLGKRGEIYSIEDIADYWEANKDTDPKLQKYSFWYDWFRSIEYDMEQVQGRELNESFKDEMSNKVCGENYSTSEIYYVDVNGLFGPINEIYSEEDLMNYWRENRYTDYVLQEYSSFQDWFNDTTSDMLVQYGDELD